jgi:xylulokinase
MNTPTFLGIDLGTSEIKVLLLSADGKVIGSAGAPLTISQPHEFWAEQNPEDWVNALYLTCTLLRNEFPDDYINIKGIGLSGQMHGATLLDATGKVLRPCILWNDARSSQECIHLKNICPDIEKITGNLVMPGFTAPKLLWVQKHESYLFNKISKILLPKDYIRFRLTNEYVSDMSDASGTLWLDVANRTWSEPALSATGLTLHHMPKLVEGTDISGYLSPEMATVLGLPYGTPVAGGAGDNAASAIGLGCIHPNDGFLSLGTSGVIFLVTDKFLPNPDNAVHAFCHAIENSWHQMSVMLSAASCLHWVTQLTGSTSITEMLENISKLTPDEQINSPIFLPYLSGERTPHNDVNASGVFTGLRHAHSTAHLGYSVLEGVAFGFLDGMNALKMAGSSINQLQLVGGGSKSNFWAQLLSNTLNIKITTCEASNVGAALGAARLGQIAVGDYNFKDISSICQHQPIHQIFEPNEKLVPILSQRHLKYRNVYKNLKNNF